MRLVALIAFFASFLPSYPPTPNTPFPNSWRDDFVCFSKFMNEQTRKILFNYPQTQSELLESMFSASNLSGISYFEPEDNARFAEALGWKSQFIRVSTTEALWLEDASRVVLVIPGTNMSQGLSDFATDILFLQSAMPTGGRVHSGFLSSTRELLPRVTNLADTLPYKKEFLVVGHSLGAGIATILSRLLVETPEVKKNLLLKGIYLFGSPRVGNREFVQDFNKTFTLPNFSLVRVVNNNDFVTRIPQLGYADVNGLVYFDQHKNIFTGADAEKQMSDSIFQLPTGHDWMNDHMPYTYTEVIGQRVFNSPLCF